MTDNEALKNQIKSQGISMTHVANVLNITREALYMKLSGKTEFKASEILRLRNLLRLSPSEFDAIFFANESELKLAE